MKRAVSRVLVTLLLMNVLTFAFSIHRTVVSSSERARPVSSGYSYGQSDYLLWSYHIGDAINDVEISGDGAIVVVGSSDGNAYAINGSGCLKWKYEFGRKVTGVAISDSGNTVAAVAFNWFNGWYKLVTFNENGGVLWIYNDEAHGSGPDRDIGISPDGSLVAFGGGEWVGGCNVLLHNREGTDLWTNSMKNWQKFAEISGDNKIIAYASTRSLEVFNKQGSMLWETQEFSDEISSLSVSRSGETIAVGSRDDRVYVYSGNGSKLWSYSTTDGNEVYVAASGDGSTITVGSNDQKIVVFDRNGLKKWESEASEFVHSVSVSQDGSIVAAGSTDGYVYTFNSNGSLLWRYKTGGDAKVSLSNDGEKLIVGSNDGRVYCFSVLTMRYLADLNSDGMVNILDIAIVAKAFGTTPEDAEWNPIADAAEPYGEINILDIATVAKDYGKTV